MKENEQVTIEEDYEPLIYHITGNPEHKARYKIYYGGRGGGKSWGIARALLYCGAIRGKPLRILCAREVQNSITDSVHKLLKDEIERSEFLSQFYIVQNTQITGKNGTQFIFKGIAHDPMQIKSLEGIDICWVEEAQKVSEDSWDILIPTIRKANSEIWVSFNPYLETDSTYKRFVLNTPPNTILKKVNWQDNPYFPKELADEKDYIKEVDYDMYLHIWEGNCKTASDAQIFRGKFVIEDFSINQVAKEHEVKDLAFYFGLDWGFSQDPSVVLRCCIIGYDLYIDYEAGGRHIELDHTHKLIDKIPKAKDHIIRADSARPESVSFIKRQGYKIVSVEKWAGSIEDGIEFIRTFRKIHIHSRCKEVASEFVKYSYKVDKVTGDILPIVVDKDNHYIDALRYALAPMIKQKLSVRVIQKPNIVR